MPYRIVLQNSDKDIEKQIIDEVKKVLNKVIVSASTSIQTRTKEVLRQEIKNSPHYQSLIEPRGQLFLELGIPDMPNRIDAIIEYIVDNTVVTARKTRRGGGGTEFIGGLVIQNSQLKRGLEDVLALPEASFVTENGDTLEWLRWLLREGGRVVVRDYDVVFGPSRTSRTGFALMKKNVKRRRWSIPVEFQGTANNNFLTEAIDRVSARLDGILDEEFARRL